MADTAPNNRRTWRMRLGCGAIVLLLFGAILGSSLPPILRGRNRFQARARLEAIGAIVQFQNVDHRRTRSALSQVLHDRLEMEIEPVKSIIVQRPILHDGDQLLLSAFEEIEVVQCRETRMNDEAFRRLTELKNLKALFLGPHSIGAESFPQIGNLTRLEILSTGAEVDRRGFEALARLTKLRSLDLRGGQILTRPPQSFLSSQCAIQQLIVGGNHTEIALSLDHLSGMVSVRELQVWTLKANDRPRLDNNLVASISAFPNLEKLTVVGCEVPGEFSPDLFTAPNLKTMLLHSCQMDRQSLDRCSSWNGKPAVTLSGSATVIDAEPQLAPRLEGEM